MNRKITLVILFLVFAAGLFLLSSKKENTGGKKYSCANCNVIFIGVDALQASHVSSLGYPRETTPTLDKLAAEGFNFSQAISPSSWTVPAYMSVFTSAYPSVHKLVNRYVEFSKDNQKLSNISELSPNIVTLAEELKGAGYATGGFTGDAGISAVLGYDKGFDAYTDEVRFGGFANSEKHALEWLDKNGDKKFFMFLHGYDTHGQFDIEENYKSRFAPEGYGGIFKGTELEQAEMREAGLLYGFLDTKDEDVEFWRAWYDGKIRDADDRLASFISELERRGLMSKTVIVVFSDHGTEFFEHQRVDHGHTLYDELVRVPLIVRVPNVDGGKVISSQVSTMDIAPTLFDILGLVPSQSFGRQMAGQSLVPYFSNPSDAGRDVYTETDYRGYTHKRAVRSHDGWKYILTLEDMEEELYSLKNDPSETNNLINVEKETAQRLRNNLYGHMRDKLSADPAKTIPVGCLPAYPDQCK